MTINCNKFCPPIKSAMQRLGKALDAIEKWSLVLLLIGIITLIFSGVLSRFVFHYSIAFSEELARFIFLWAGLLGASAAFKSGEHNGIPLIVNRFSKRWQRVIEICVALGILIFMSYLVYMSGLSTFKSFQSGQVSTTTEIPVWVINFGMMLAFLIGVIRCIQGFFLGAFKAEQRPQNKTLDMED